MTKQSQNSVESMKQMVHVMMNEVKHAEAPLEHLTELVKLIGLYKSLLDIEEKQIKLSEYKDKQERVRSELADANTPLSDSEWELLEESVTRWRDAQKNRKKPIDK